MDKDFTREDAYKMIKEFFLSARGMLEEENTNINLIIKRIENISKDRLSELFACYQFPITTKMLADQIYSNLMSGNLLIAIIGLRSMLENYINMTYIFQHPEHLGDIKWIEDLCIDFAKRTSNKKSNKSKLGGDSFYQRTKQVGKKEFYDKLYGDLCNYVHFNEAVLYTSKDSNTFTYKTIEVLIYTITMYHDVLGMMATYLNVPFRDFREPIERWKDSGSEMLFCLKAMIEQEKKNK